MKNKTKLQPNPFLLLVIVNRHEGHNVVNILNKNKIESHINCIGHGTSESGIAELFGFGIIERDMVLSIIPNELNEKILDDLNNVFNFDEPHKGLALTIPVNKIEKKLLNLITF
jgi:hypothetical protein